MTGTLGEIVEAYAAQRVAVYPLDGKRPAVKHYDKIGVPAARQLAMRFEGVTAGGFCAGSKNRLTIIDIDRADERLLHEVEERYGRTPLRGRTPKGGWHLYFRHNGERRRIKPIDDVDILGDGNVVALGSIVSKGRYEIEIGTLEDLPRLPKIRREQLPESISTLPSQRVIPDGTRDFTVFKLLLRIARDCEDFDTLLARAREMNMQQCVPPMTDARVVQKATSAWKYETSGRNWVGRKARASTDRDEILAMSHHPAATMLLLLLRVSHPVPDDRFAIDQLKTSELLKWSRDRLVDAIESLIAQKRLERVYRGSGRWDPHLYQLCR